MNEIFIMGKVVSKKEYKFIVNKDYEKVKKSIAIF